MPKDVIDVEALTALLQCGSDEPVLICVLRRNKLMALNKIRNDLGELPFCNGRVWLCPRVIEKLRRKRLQNDKRTPEQLAKTILRVLMSAKTRVLPSRYRHIQSLDLLKPDGHKTEVVYVGKIKSGISLKSAYIQSAENLNKFASGGAVQPPMKSDYSDNAPTSVISGTRSKC